MDLSKINSETRLKIIKEEFLESFQDHHGHKIEITDYMGQDFSLECHDCMEVIISIENN